MLRSGLVGKRLLKAINEQLLAPDPQLDDARSEKEATVLYSLRTMLEALSLVRAVNNKLVSISKNALEIPTFWSGSLAEQIGACLRQWPKVAWAPLLHAPEYEYDANPETGARALRQKLTTISPNLWVEPADLLDELQNENINFLFVQHEKIETSSSSYYSGYLGSSYLYGDRAKILEKLTRLEELFVRNSIEHFLMPLGLVELGYAQTGDAQWQAFRLTSLGEIVLTEAPAAPADNHQGAIIVQPNFQVLAMGPVQFSQLAQLDLFAERQRADVGAFEYRLTRESVYAAQQSGMDASTIQQTLGQMSGGELPQNVRRTLEEWSAHHERIVFHTRVDLLQTADQALLTKLQETAASGAQMERPLTPTVALIKGLSQKKLVTALLAAEILPVISSANPNAADASVVITETGLIQPIHRAPSLHLRGRLARVAAEDDDGWRLTKESVRRVGGSQKKVEALLADLGKL
ncbi:MAG: helicase-associated domain-containing protein, partial [Caldilineaceae bacterium]|nr:helicase-associated domain-containing protein [Caldilineaceae bacterium]